MFLLTQSSTKQSCCWVLVPLQPLRLFFRTDPAAGISSTHFAGRHNKPGWGTNGCTTLLGLLHLLRISPAEEREAFCGQQHAQPFDSRVCRELLLLFSYYSVNRPDEMWLIFPLFLWPVYIYRLVTWLKPVGDSLNHKYHDEHQV